jgi:hypothetical protein
VWGRSCVSAQPSFKGSTQHKDLCPFLSIHEESYTLKKGMKKCEIHWEAGYKFPFKASPNQNFTRFGHKNEKNSEIFVELSKNQDSQLIKVIHKVTLSFTPYPLFQWYPQSEEILLNLNMKCWNSAFNARGFESNYSDCTGRSSENICSISGGAQEKGKSGMKLSLLPILVAKLVWVPVILFCKISFPVTHLMPYWCAETGRSRRAQWTSTDQRTIQRMPIITQLWMNPNWVTIRFHLGNQFCKKY